MASNLLPHELLSKPDISAIKSIGVCSHTDEVTSADIFIAQGSGQHHHIQQALDKGAVAVICQSGSCDSGVLSKSGKVYEVECLDDFMCAAGFSICTRHPDQIDIGNIIAINLCQ